MFFITRCRRQGAEAEHGVQVADAVVLAELLQLVAHGRRAAGDDHARVDQVAVGGGLHLVVQPEVTRDL